MRRPHGGARRNAAEKQPSRPNNTSVLERITSSTPPGHSAQVSVFHSYVVYITVPIRSVIRCRISALTSYGYWQTQKMTAASPQTTRCPSSPIMFSKWSLFARNSCNGGNVKRTRRAVRGNKPGRRDPAGARCAGSRCQFAAARSSRS
jgi:hypothetical protein